METTPCINRNIVECKVRKVGFIFDFSSSINRNIVECKDVLDLDFKIITFLVLIETSWNVKCLPQTIRILRPHCINRNIVECKDIYSFDRMIEERRINRNIVECKVSYSTEDRRDIISINRNIVECKASRNC